MRVLRLSEGNRVVRKRSHRHVCDCGDWLVCAEADQCAVPEPYECPNCVQRQLDMWAEIEMRRDEHEQHMNPLLPLELTRR